MIFKHNEFFKCFQPQILQPTRITDHSATLIDNIFFNSLEHFTISGNVIYDISDHLPNFLIFDKFSSLSNNVKLYKRDYSHFNQQHLLSELQVIDWHKNWIKMLQICLALSMMRFLP